MMSSKRKEKKARKRNQKGNVQLGQADVGGLAVAKRTARQGTQFYQIAGISGVSQATWTLPKTVTKMQTVGDMSLTITGTEYLSPAGNTNVSSLVALVDLNPATWDGTRVQRIAQLYEKYTLDYLRVCYVPAMGMNQTGTIILGIETDPEEKIPVEFSALSAFRNTLASAFNAVGSLNASNVLEYRRSQSDTRLLYSSVSADARETSPGYLYAAVPDAAVSTNCGHLWCEYKFTLHYPEIEVGNEYAGSFTGTTVTNVNSTVGSPITIDNSALSQNVSSADEIIILNDLVARKKSTTSDSTYFEKGSHLFTKVVSEGGVLVRRVYATVSEMLAEINPLLNVVATTMTAFPVFRRPYRRAITYTSGGYV